MALNAMTGLLKSGSRRRSAANLPLSIFLKIREYKCVQIPVVTFIYLHISLPYNSTDLYFYPAAIGSHQCYDLPQSGTRLSWVLINVMMFPRAVPCCHGFSSML